MKILKPDCHAGDSYRQADATPVAVFVAEHGAALWHAARLLGGYEQARLVDRLADALENEPRPTTRVGIMLDQLLDLLTLQNAGDPDRAEWGFFVVLDPGDPAVEEICLLADGLKAAMEATRRLARDPATADRKAA